MRSFANICNVGIKRDQMDATSSQVCVSVPSGHYSSLENGFSAEMKHNAQLERPKLEMQ